MKNILTSTAIVALLLTVAQADFDFGDVFKDLKTNTSVNSKAPVPNSDFVFGDVFKDLKTATGENAKAPNKDFVFGDVFKDMKHS